MHTQNVTKPSTQQQPISHKWFHVNWYAEFTCKVHIFYSAQRLDLWRNIHRKHHTIPISSFYALIVANRAQWIFKGNFFVYRPNRTKLSGIFALALTGPKVQKNRGWVPLWGEFNGEVENLAPNFSPPNYRRAAVGGGLDVGARALPNFISPATWAIKFGRKKLFYEKFFFGRKLQGKNGGKFSGNTAPRSYTVPIAFGQGGIAILWLRFAMGSPGN